MRITGGTVRGRKLFTPKSGHNSIRPTSDRVREALFNILADRVADSRVLDLFAGTGALGIEALSRGAALAVFIDQSSEAKTLITKNLHNCFDRPQAAFIRIYLGKGNDSHLLKAKLGTQLQFDLIFMDPPYEKKLAEKALTMVEETQILAPGGMVIVEERHHASLPEQTGCLRIADHRQYGETGIWLYTSTSSIEI